MRKVRTAAALIVACLAAGATFAEVSFSVPADLPIPQSTLTHAEVLADLVVWRAAGLPAFTNNTDFNVDASSYQYLKAKATYDYLRSSPQFAALVDHIKKGESASAIIASGKPGLAGQN